MNARAEHVGVDRRVVLVDNYDSFTWNLVQAFQTCGADVHVVRNDQVAVDEVFALDPTHIVVSPGPGRPEDAGISVSVVRAALKRRLPLLGVCLGHQTLGWVLGGQVVSAPELMHGKSSPVHHDNTGLFADLINPFDAGRYHSLVLAPDVLPASLVVSARTADGVIMGVRHRTCPAAGVQFHPESLLTPDGGMLLTNFLRWTGTADPREVCSAAHEERIPHRPDVRGPV